MYEYHSLSSGLAIYKQKASKNYYIYLKTKEGEFRKSLKTSSKDEATMKAWHLHFSYTENIHPEIFTDSSSTVANICNKLCKRFDAYVLQTNNKRSQQFAHSSILKNDIAPILGKLKIKQLGIKEMREVVDSASNKTKHSNIRKCLKHIFEYAVEHRLLESYKVPDIPKKTEKIKKGVARPIFSSHDLELMSTNFDSFISNSRKSLTTEYRTILKYMCSFLLLTGIRPGEEVINLKYSNVSKINTGESYAYRVIIKTGKTENHKSANRQVVIDSETFSVIQSIARNLHKISDTSFEDLRKLDLYIFRPLSDNSKKPDFSKIFEQFVNYIKMPNPLALYSFRHTYITRKLTEGVDVYLLSKHCGNSVAMIEGYYDKLETTVRAPESINLTSYVKINIEKRK